MATVTLTQTEFLLARIADTIATAREVQALAVTRGIQPDDPREPALRLALIVLAECEAKRRIVEYATNQHTSGPDWDLAVEFLAAVYADHPDYREEWKP